MPLMRTEYWNLSTGTVRGGATGHGESLTDVESYLLPLDRIRGASFHGWGVAHGLHVRAEPDQPGVTVAPGVALDAVGRLVVLADGGFAVVDPDVDPNQVQNVPTVPAGADGVVLDTAGLSGECFLTLTWREVLGESQLANAPVLMDAPWLRLSPVAGFQDIGQQVVLAQVTLDDDGLVTDLSAEGRRLVGVPAGRLELRVPRAAGGPGLGVDQEPAAELRARADGGLDLNLLSPGGAARPALSVDGRTGDLTLTSQDDLTLTSQGDLTLTSQGDLTLTSQGDLVLAPRSGNVGIGTANPSAKLEIDRAATNDVALRLASSGAGWGSGLQFSNRAAGAKTYGTYSGDDGRWHFTDADNQADRLVIDQAGNVGIGIGASQAQRTVHVEGSEIHSGGTGGGFSFTDRDTGEFVDWPDAGKRWVWYALGGSARLWSAGDVLTISATGEGGALDVSRRMRVRQGGDASAGIWFHQTEAQTDCAFVGMADDTAVGFWGNTGAGWGLRMDTTDGRLFFGGDFGRPDGPATISLFGSHIGDTGGGVLFIRSGGSTIAFNGGDNVGIGTSTPQAKLDVRGNVIVNGFLEKRGGGFKIDHPLDPANKYLSHSFVESPEMTNIYGGTIVTDDHGEATVVLPDFFEALNREPRYQLTPIGQLAQAVVIDEVRDNRFTIRTDKPGVTVSWQVTGVRQDAWANANRIEVEEDKPPAERRLHHPEVHEQPANNQRAAAS